MDGRIISYFSGKMGQSERMDFMREIEQNAELRSEFARYRNMTGMVALTAHAGDEAEGKQSYHTFRKRHKDSFKRKTIVRIAGYAAVIAVLLVGVWYASWVYQGRDVEREISYNTLHVPAGQRASITLSDGTAVWLNAKSTLIYPSRFKKGERKVELKGEAYFDVAADPEQPFIINTSSLNIKVLGTTFNVNDYVEMQSASVSLLEGKVEISVPESEEAAITMLPMHTLTYSGGKTQLTNVVDGNDFLWKQGIFHFDEVPLSVIVGKLEWYYDVKIEIANPRISENVYTGKFRQQDGVYEILKIIQNIQKFRIEKDDANREFILK